MYAYSYIFRCFVKAYLSTSHFVSVFLVKSWIPELKLHHNYNKGSHKQDCNLILTTVEVIQCFYVFVTTPWKILPLNVVLF